MSETEQLGDDIEGFELMSKRLSHMLERSRLLGASGAEATLNASSGLSVTVRQGEVETLQRHRGRAATVTVYFGRSKGSASSGDWNPAALDATVRAACDFAKETAPDPHAGLPDSECLERAPRDLRLDHPWRPRIDEAVEIAQRCERAALEVDSEINNSDGATVSTRRGQWMLANSQGFLAGYPATRHSLTCSVVGERAGAMQRGSWYSTARSFDALESPESVGERAGRRAWERLGACPIGTRAAPVLFAPEAARGLIGHLLAAASGGNLYRGASFLVDRLGDSLFPASIRMVEDPHLPGGLGSAPFDAEGVATLKRDLVSEGVLRGFLLNSYSARKLNLVTTGNAGGAHNVSLEPGPLDYEGMLEEMDTGLVVTELMGQGVNLTTGDYSRGATGFWVQGGEVVHPVEEVTIAGTLQDMYRHVLAVGRDVDERGTVRCGSMLVESMAIAGR